MISLNHTSNRIFNDKKMIAKINAEIKSTQSPNFSGMIAELRDADPVSDDLLATATVQSTGKAEFLFDTEDVASGDSPFEKRPDLYLLIKDSNGSPIFRSAILPDIDFEKRDPISGDRLSTLNLVFSSQPQS